MTISAAQYAGGCDTVWCKGDAGGGQEGLPAEHHLLPCAQLHTAGQAVQPLRSDVPHPAVVTKMDVRAYLAAVYGVQMTYIRTDNYFTLVRCVWNGVRCRQARRAILLPDDSRGHVRGGP